MTSKVKFLKALKHWVLVKASRLAGIDDFTCDDDWDVNKSDWYNCYHYLTKEGK